jgi:hypothetical protein
VQNPGWSRRSGPDCFGKEVIRALFESAADVFRFALGRGSLDERAPPL